MRFGNILEKFNDKQMEKYPIDKFPSFRAGDTISVSFSSESGKQRIRPFSGLCIARFNKGLHSSFLVRSSVAIGMAVEKRFRLYSPHLVKIEVLKRGKVRRAKLYYIRNLFGKAARIKERRQFVNQK